MNCPHDEADAVAPRPPARESPELRGALRLTRSMRRSAYDATDAGAESYDQLVAGDARAALARKRPPRP